MKLRRIGSVWRWVWPSRWRWRRALLVIALLAFLPLAFYVPAANLWGEHHYRLAEKALERRDFSGARAHLEKCLKVWPESGPTFLLLARAARRQGHFQQADWWLNCCRNVEGPTEKISLERSLIQAQQGNLGRELEDRLNNYVDQGYPDASLILEALSQGYRRVYRLHNALACLNRWIEREPNNAEALFQRGWVQERMNQFELALEDYRQSVAADPDHFFAQLHLAKNLLRVGRPKAAAEIFEKLHQKQPDDPDAGLGLAQAWNHLGRTEEVQKLLEKLVSEHPGVSDILTERGKLELDLGQTAEAENYLRRALELDLFDYQANYSLSLCLHKIGKEKEAEGFRARAKQIDADQKQMVDLMDDLQNRPFDVDLRCEIGRLFLRNGQRGLAKFWLQSALQLDPGNQTAQQALAESKKAMGP